MRLAELTIEMTDSLVVARFSGDIDLSNAAELREELQQAIPNDALGLVLDLGAVDYLDSAGIHAIHRVREELRTRNQKLRLVIPPDSIINDTLRLAGLDWSGDIVDAAESARRSLGPAPGS